MSKFMIVLSGLFFGCTCFLFGFWLSIFLGFSGFGITTTVSAADFYDSVMLLENGSFEEYDRIGRVSCESNSMGLTVNCGDMLYEVGVGPDDELWKGQIYVYNQSNLNETNNEIYYESIVHRLVGCVDEDCNVTIFKGDNNHISEFVNRSDILYRVVMTKYK